jgi:hypothetical protein
MAPQKVFFHVAGFGDVDLVGELDWEPGADPVYPRRMDDGNKAAVVPSTPETVSLWAKGPEAWPVTVVPESGDCETVPRQAWWPPFLVSELV